MKDFLLKKMALPTIVLVWAASYYVEVMGYSEKNHKLIQPVFWVIVLLYVINGITDYREWKASQGDKAGQTERSAQPKKKLSLKSMDWNSTGKVVAAISAMVIYVAMLDLLGFVISTFLFVGAILYMMGERKWFLLAGVPLGLDILLYVVFKIALSIPLPAGFLGF